MSPTILVVDDSAAERLYVSHLLRRKTDFRVICVKNGEDAIRSITTDSPAVIVSDVRMPQMNGLQLVQELRELGCAVPVILMTSAGTEQLVVEALLSGAASYVPKFNIETTLVNAVQQVIAAFEQQSARRNSCGAARLSDWQFDLKNDPSSVPSLISFILDTVVQLRELNEKDLPEVVPALKAALAKAKHHGSLDLNPEIRQLLHEALDSRSERRALVACPQW